MVCFKKYCAILIAAALILSAVPVYYSEDAFRGNRVDLRDVIMLIQEVSAENSLSLPPASLRDLMSGIQVVAGMRTVIQASDDNSEFSTGDAFCYLPCFISEDQLPICVTDSFQMGILYKYIPDDAPIPPPPELVYKA